MSVVSGIIENYSKTYGGVMIDRVWYSPDKNIKNKFLNRLNADEIKKGDVATLTLNEGTTFFTKCEVSVPDNMTTKDFVSKLNESSQTKVVESVSEDNYENLLIKGKLMIKLAKDLRDAYMNESGKVELKDAELELINSVLKAVLWGK